MDRVCIGIRETVVTVQAEFRAKRESLRIALPHLGCAISPPMAALAARIASLVFVHVARMHRVFDCKWCIGCCVHVCLSLALVCAHTRINGIGIDPRSVRNLENCDRQFAVTGECEYVSFVLSAQVPFSRVRIGIDRFTA